MTQLEAQAPDFSSTDERLINFSFRLPAISVVLGLGLLLRLALATVSGFAVDLGTFQAWSNELASKGPWDFYDAGGLRDYAPGYMYVLWAFGGLHKLFDFSPATFEYILKLPSIVADLASAYLLYRLLDGQKMDVRLGSATLYLLFPATLLIGPIWGQADSLLAFFLLLAVYFIGRDRPVAGAVAYTVGFVIKPQAIAALPFLVFWIMRRSRSVPVSALVQMAVGAVLFIAALLGFAIISEEPQEAYNLFFAGLAVIGGAEFVRGALNAYWSRDSVAPPAQLRDLALSFQSWYAAAGLSMLVFLILITPFFTYEPWKIIAQLYNAADVENYRVNSFWAYNFWNIGGLFESGFRPDISGVAGQNPGVGEFLGFDHRMWGLAMFGLSLVGILSIMRKTTGTGALALGTALSVLVFYVFLTRMHERYLFAFFLPCLAACALIQSQALWALFAGIGTLHFFNLYHVFVYYNPEELKVERLYNWFADNGFLFTGWETVQVLSFLVFVCVPLLLLTAYFVTRRPTGAGAA